MPVFSDLPVQYWPVLIGMLATVLGCLRWFGLLTRPADSGDLKVFQTKLETLENFHHENREEHESIRAKNAQEHREIMSDVKDISKVVNRIEIAMAKVETKIERLPQP